MDSEENEHFCLIEVLWIFLLALPFLVFLVFIFFIFPGMVYDIPSSQETEQGQASTAIGVVSVSFLFTLVAAGILIVYFDGEENFMTRHQSTLNQLERR